MRTRLEDLIATADRQLASRSFDAAIDTYRTALGEPGADEAGIAERLEAACRTRDEALGVVRPVEPIAAPPAPPMIELVEPEPAPARLVDQRPIEAPSFHLIEDDPSMLERPRRGPYPLEVEKVSILNPKPLPEGGDPLLMARIAVAAVIAVAVCVLVLLLK